MNKTIKKILKFPLWFLHYYLRIDLYLVFPKYSTKMIKKRFGDKELIGAEVGVFAGENAKSILKNLNIKTLYLIDPYEDCLDYNMEDIPMDLKTAERKAIKKLKKYKDKIVWIRKMSDDALNYIPDNLDFVYIDGNHKYKYVKQDMNDYWKKVREGGILCGHDIPKPEVTKAFAEFIVEKNIKVNRDIMKSDLSIDFQDWIVVKREHD